MSNGLSITKLNIYSYFFYSTFVLTIIGTLILSIDITSHYLGHKILNNHTVPLTLLSVNISFFLVTYILYVLDNKKFLNKDKVYSYRDKLKERVVSIPNYNKKIFNTIFVLLLIISISSVFYTFFSIGIDKIPILKLFQGTNSTQLAILRQQVGRNFNGISYIKNIFALGLTPILSYIAVAHYLSFKNKRWLYFSIITVFFNILILTYDLQKAPVLRFFFAYLFIFPLVLKNRIKIRKSYIISFTLIIALMFVFITGNSIAELFSFTGGPINRIFRSQAFSVFAHFELFPDNMNFLFGRSLPSFITKTIFNSGQIRSARLVMEYFYPLGVAAGTSGVMNGFFISEAYANFSYFGIFLSVILVSIEMYIIHTVFLKSRKTSVSIAAYAYISNQFVNTTQGGFIDFLYNPVVFIMLALLFILQKVYIRENKYE